MKCFAGKTRGPRRSVFGMVGDFGAARKTAAPKTRALLFLAMLPALAPVQRKHKRPPKPVKAVRFETDWETTLEQARVLRRPIVVHSHKLNDRGGWRLHKSLLQNRDYIRFANKNTLEVMVFVDLEDLEGEHERLATFVKRVPGSGKVARLAMFPDLTLEQLRTLSKSGASEYNLADESPFTTVVDPFTGGAIQSFQGPLQLDQIKPIVLGARKEFIKRQGNPKLRRQDLDKLQTAKSRMAALTKDGKWTKALDIYGRSAKKVKHGPRKWRKQFASLHEDALRAGAIELDKLAKQLGTSATTRRLVLLTKQLAGTRLEKRVADLLQQSRGK